MSSNTLKLRFLPALPSTAVRYDTAQSLTSGQQSQARTNIGAAGTADLAVLQGQVQAAEIIPPQGRLTLSSGNPVVASISGVSGSTAIYYTPYVGNILPIYNGTGFTRTQFSELTNTTTDATKNPAAVAASKNYDLFVWNDSGNIRLSRGPAWSADNGRGTGAGTTELQRVSGIWTNKVAITNGPGAGLGTYVGTVRSNASSTIDFFYGGSASGGSQALLMVWNAYNRVLTTARTSDNGASYTYATGTQRVARASTGNGILFVVGLQEDAIHAAYTGTITTGAGAGNQGRCGIAVNQSNSEFGVLQAVRAATAVATTGSFHASYNGFLSSGTGLFLGSNFINAIELADGSTSTFNVNSDNTLTALLRM